MFDEFLETHIDDKKIWELKNITLAEQKKGSDDESSEGESSESESDSPNEADNLANKNISDKEYMELLKKGSKSNKASAVESTSKNHGPNKFFTVKLKGLAYNHKKKDIKIFFKGIKPKSIRVPQKIKGIAFVGFKTEKQLKLALNKNKCFLGNK